MAEGLTKSERQSYREYVENNPRVARFRARHPDAALNWKQVSTDLSSRFLKLAQRERIFAQAV